MKLSRRDLLRAASGLAIASLHKNAPASSVPAEQISSAAGLTVLVFNDGSYQINAPAFGWTFGGAVGQPLASIGVSSGADMIGGWQEIDFTYGTGRGSAIRLYNAQVIVLFSTSYASAAANDDPFPVFTSFPQGLSTFSYSSLWAYNFGALSNASPWLFFDSQANSILLSPAANFMTAVSQIASDGSIQAGINSQITTLPAGFTHRALLALAPGVNAAFDLWGQTLTGLSGKNRVSNDAIPLLNQASYWTDAGAAYYYNPSDPTQYIPTLLQVPADVEHSSAPVGSMELDSWHYPKGSPPSWTNNGGGMFQFQADSTLFPNGLGAFQQTLALPLITHARWIDASSPLRNQYQMSGNVSIDPQYWSDYSSYLAGNGVQVFEQDWLAGPAVTNFNLTDPDAFLGNMASAMQAAGLNIMYCMPLWTHIMQSSKYSNVIAARVSNDAFQRARWDELIFNSSIASAVGLWPFADNFASANEKDVLVATLTAGPLGLGDKLGSTVASNIGRAVRADGVIVKPDVPITATDATYVAVSANQASPIVAFTYTDHGAGLRTGYVLAYTRTAGSQSAVSFTLQSLGISTPAFVYDYFQGTGTLVEAGGSYSSMVDYSGSYYIVAQLGMSGIAFIGDAGKFVCCGKKRVEQLSDNGLLQVLVRFAPGEERLSLLLYSAVEPAVEAGAGKVAILKSYGAGIHRVTVSPSQTGEALVSFRI